VLITFEGIDGSGKGTQAARLVERLRTRGIAVDTFSFPQYGRNPFAEAVSEYLNGTLGDMKDVHPKLVSLLYAGDRFTVAGDLRRLLGAGTVVVCDRYVESNLAHQAARMAPGQRDGFVDWLRRVEYGVFGLPVPDLTVLLDIPADLAQDRVWRKGARAYTRLAADVHEADQSHLATTAECYRALAGTGGPWRVVSTVDADGAPLGVEAIGERCWALVHPVLPAS
jgi:dTMP kinase